MFFVHCLLEGGRKLVGELFGIRPAILGGR